MLMYPYKIEDEFIDLDGLLVYSGWQGRAETLRQAICNGCLVRKNIDLGGMAVECLS